MYATEHRNGGWQMKHILVCGGAGYIGAHMAKRLAQAGYRVTVLDNLSTGHRAAVRWGDLVVGDVLDSQLLAELFSRHPFDAVMHFAALSVVGDSARSPIAYYTTNISGTLNLLAAMNDAGVTRIVFSSSAAVYGIPQSLPIDESQALAPINPYGASKAMIERVLADAAASGGPDSVSLRYFNAAGADPQGGIGESHAPETHLIPNVLRAAAAGSSVCVFGDDYDTHDGTCVRDYIHVNDLVDAHLLALEYMDAQPGAHAFNLGSGAGFSVLEVIEAARRVTGNEISCDVTARRPGDPPTLVAASDRARRQLGWRPEFEDIESIVETAWRWHCAPSY